MSLSRRGCKQPFHRLFGRLAFVVVYGIVCKPTSNPFESPFSNVKTKRTGKYLSVRFDWRKLRDSNPCAFWANGFQDRLVMTTSISFRLYKVDSNFLIDFIYYILNKNKNQMIEAIFQTFLSIAAFYNFVNSFNELVF